MTPSSPPPLMLSCCPSVEAFLLVFLQLLGSPSLSSPVSLAAVRHPCVRCEGLLTGHAGYFNVGGLCRLDIPGSGVSCAIRTSLPGDTYVQRFDCAEICSHVEHTRPSCNTHTEPCVGSFSTLFTWVQKAVVKDCCVHNCFYSSLQPHDLCLMTLLNDIRHNPENKT